MLIRVELTSAGFNLKKKQTKGTGSERADFFSAVCCVPLPGWKFDADNGRRTPDAVAVAPQRRHESVGDVRTAQSGASSHTPAQRDAAARNHSGLLYRAINTQLGATFGNDTVLMFICSRELRQKHPSAKRLLKMTAKKKTGKICKARRRRQLGWR